jgi:hypothetical protein
VAAAGNSNSPNYYSYLHSTPAGGINYYRILQRDLDGRFSYSDIRSVKLTHENLPFTVLVNPVANHILALQVNMATTLSLYAFNGNLLWKKQFAAGTTTIDMGSYAKGVYLLKANGYSETIILR